jgi:hypothetical protein
MYGRHLIAPHQEDMMQRIVAALTVAVFAFFGWLPILLSLGLIRDLPRLLFVLGHYLLDILVFGGVFAAYYRNVGHFSPFATMAIAMLSLFAIEFIYWKFLYTGELWFLNFVDWIVPAFLVASTIYFVGLLFE